MRGGAPSGVIPATSTAWTAPAKPPACAPATLGVPDERTTTFWRWYGPPCAVLVVSALARLEEATFIRVRSTASPDADTSMAVNKSILGRLAPRVHVLGERLQRGQHLEAEAPAIALLVQIAAELARHLVG